MITRASIVLALAACGADPPVPEKVVPAPAKAAAPVVADPKTPPVPEAVDADTGDGNPASVSVPPPRPDLRSSVYFRATTRGRASVWHASSTDPSVAEQLPFVVDYEKTGAVDVGTSTPLLSASGVWLAYLDLGHLAIGALDGTTKQRVTRHGPAQVTVLVSGFSPDSAYLLYEQHEVQGEHALPLPADVVAGFQLLALPRAGSKHLPTLGGFVAWSPGSTKIFFERKRSAGSELVAHTLSTDAQEVQQSIADTRGFARAVVAGDFIAYVRSPGGQSSQIVRAKLDGSELVALTDEGDFARYQWPRLSVDAKRVAYRDGADIVIVASDGTGRSKLHACGSECDHRWDSATSVMVLDGSELARYELDGSKTVIASDAVGFAVAGEPR